MNCLAEAEPRLAPAIDPEETRERATPARQRVEKRFDARLSVTKLIHLYIGTRPVTWSLFQNLRTANFSIKRRDDIDAEAMSLDAASIVKW